MNKQDEPLLSIGLIFRNEVRCLERCMKSLEPLRHLVPSELIMVDTGSNDGSREIAAQYADIIVDFPWINDFAAARNVAMDQARGIWYLSIDADEWLDQDVTGLVRFLQKDKNTPAAFLVVRNYISENFEEYLDNHLLRLLRLSTGLRYTGAIHETWNLGKLERTVLRNVLLHHDGYIDLLGEHGKEKRDRNRSILRTDLKKDPNNLRLLMSYIDCSRHENDCSDYIFRACDLVEKKMPGWKFFGPPIFRYSVFYAGENDLPELDTYVDRAVKWFPDSFFTMIDVAQTALFGAWKKENFPACIYWGEMYLGAVDDLNCGNGDQEGLQYGSLFMYSPRLCNSVRVITAIANLKEKKLDQALELLKKLDASRLSVAQIGNLVALLRELHVSSGVDTTSLISRIYDKICQPIPSKEIQYERQALFIRMAYAAFDPTVQQSELKEPDFHRLSYTAFLPLADRCDLGRSAAIMETEDAETATSYLTQIENWDKLPILVLEHALELGVPFPLENRPLTLEEMDGLAGRMSGEVIVNLALQAVDNAAESNWQTMIWARELTLAAIQSDCWSEVEQSMNLCRAFAKIESATLPRYYGDEALKEENISTLPPAHRFGWYCIRAFEALDAGDRKEYMHLLRLGLTSCPAMKSMVEFLVANTPEIKETITPSSELLSLAEQVRTLLASFAPGDPALEAIRSSEAYQKVAYLIEGTDAGGLPS